MITARETKKSIFLKLFKSFEANNVASLNCTFFLIFSTICKHMTLGRHLHCKNLAAVLSKRTCMAKFTIVGLFHKYATFFENLHKKKYKSFQNYIFITSRLVSIHLIQRFFLNHNFQQMTSSTKSLHPIVKFLIPLKMLPLYNMQVVRIWCQ